MEVTRNSQLFEIFCVKNRPPHNTITIHCLSFPLSSFFPHFPHLYVCIFKHVLKELFQHGNGVDANDFYDCLFNNSEVIKGHFH